MMKIKIPLFQLVFFLPSPRAEAACINSLKQHASPRVCCLPFPLACLFIVPANLSFAGATDARQLPVFVVRESLADMRVLNSAPASRGVPLHGSRWARGTLSLPLPPSASLFLWRSHIFSPLSLPRLSFSLAFPLCLPAPSPWASRAPPSLAHRRWIPAAWAGPQGTILFPARRGEKPLRNEGPHWPENTANYLPGIRLYPSWCVCVYVCVSALGRLFNIVYRMVTFKSLQSFENTNISNMIIICMLSNGCILPKKYCPVIIGILLKNIFSTYRNVIKSHLRWTLESI